MTGLLQDIVYALRVFRKSPGFAITAVATLALGIGGTTAIFSIVNAVLLKPLGIPDPDRLAVLGTTGADGTGMSPAKYRHLQAESSVFQDVSANVTSLGNQGFGGLLEQKWYTRTSANFFRCVGIRILRGRTFALDEELPNGARVAVISEKWWRQRFASDANAVGKKLILSGETFTIIGVVADVAGFAGIYIPFQIEANSRDQSDYFQVLTRLKPGISLEQARARLRISAVQYRAKYPGALDPKETFTAVPYREDLVTGDRPLLLVLMGAVSLVLLIACANVANLLLIEASGRRREMAIRAALGASRGRVIRQMLTETVLLAVAGSASGLLLGQAALRALLAVNNGGLDLLGENGSGVGIDWRVAGFALALSLLTGILFGLYPAMKISDANLQVGAGPSRNRSRGLFVMAEVSLAVVLLVGSGLLIRSFVALYQVDPGFDAKNVWNIDVLVSGPKYSKTSAVASTIRSGLESIRSLPGVEAASATCCLPIAQGTYDLGFEILGRPAAVASQAVGWATVSSGFFDVFRIPVKRGRTITEQDDHRSPPVVVINERLAKQFWPNSDPLGAKIVIGKDTGSKDFEHEPVREIVGVVGDIRSEGLDAKPRPILYVPQAQLPDAETAMFLKMMPMAWVVRTRGEPAGLAREIQKRAMQSTGLPVSDVVAMEHILWSHTGRERFSMFLMMAFGASAMLLAAIGIYGLVAHTVEQRRKEIGIRLALGADGSEVRSMVFRHGMGFVVGGLAVGLAGALGLTRAMSSLLFGVPAHDPFVFAVAPVVLGTVGAMAVWVAARSASEVGVADLLRRE